MKILMIMLISLCSTIIIETIVAFIIGFRKKIDFINVILVNLLTNPIVVSVSLAINILCGLFYRHVAMIFLELGAFLVEGYIYTKYLKYNKLNGFVVSLILNIFSYCLGLLINFIIW